MSAGTIPENQQNFFLGQEATQTINFKDKYLKKPLIKIKDFFEKLFNKLLIKKDTTTPDQEIREKYKISILNYCAGREEHKEIYKSIVQKINNGQTLNKEDLSKDTKNLVKEFKSIEYRSSLELKGIDCKELTSKKLSILYDLVGNRLIDQDQSKNNYPLHQLADLLSNISDKKERKDGIEHAKSFVKFENSENFDEFINLVKTRPVSEWKYYDTLLNTQKENLKSVIATIQDANTTGLSLEAHISAQSQMIRSTYSKSVQEYLFPSGTLNLERYQLFKTEHHEPMELLLQVARQQGIDLSKTVENTPFEKLDKLHRKNLLEKFTSNKTEFLKFVSKKLDKDPERFINSINDVVLEKLFLIKEKCVKDSNILIFNHEGVDISFVVVPENDPVVLPKKDPLEMDLALFEKAEPLLEEMLRLDDEKDTKQLENDPEHRLKRSINEGQLAIILGTPAKDAGKGVNGAKLIPSLKNGYVGVFKAAPEEIWSVPGAIKTAFGQTQRELLNPGIYTEMCGERAAYLIANKLNFNSLNVPPTDIIEMDGKKGAFLVFEKGVKEVSTPVSEESNTRIIDQINQKATYSQNEKNLFQNFIIFDFLLGNLDRHEDNWMVQFEDNELKKIVPIDNSNILPLEKPAAYNMVGRYAQYAWKNCNMSKEAFTEETKQFVRDNISYDKINNLIEYINSDPKIAECYPDGVFLTKESQTLLRERAGYIQMIAQNVILTPEGLASR